MKIKNYINNLEKVASRYDDKPVYTGEVNIANMCDDIANKFEELDSLVFTAFNEKAIRNQLDQIKDQCTVKMTEAQRIAYEYGVNLVLDLLKQTAAHELEEGNIMFYHPGVKEMEEMDLDEITEWLEAKRGW